MEQEQRLDYDGLFETAQATIAALQADNRTYIDERHEHMKQIEQLQARVQELIVEIAAIRKVESQAELSEAAHRETVKECTKEEAIEFVYFYMNKLTQRTAELHQVLAAIDEGLSLNDIGLAVRTVEGVHAELERMKGREENMMHGECDICGSCEHVRHINLYVSGSEGLTVCTECEMHIVTYVRSLRQIAAKAKLRMVKFYKDQQERLKKVEL